MTYVKILLGIFLVVGLFLTAIPMSIASPFVRKGFTKTWTSEGEETKRRRRRK